MFSQPFVTFSKIANARTGNILFQYLFCIRISILYGHKYIPIEDVPSLSNCIKLTDADDDTKVLNISDSSILCEGFFQNDQLYLPIRERILHYISDSPDSWIGFSGNREYIANFVHSLNPVHINANDIVMSLRLDDFIQLPNSRSDIVPPEYYTEILEKWFSSGKNRENGRLIIVSDKFRHHWEHKYIEFFNKWSPTIVQNSLLDDFALMRDCPALIHSNSSLCWFASFLSNKKTNRFIPVTRTYFSQHLEAIDSFDEVMYVQPMEHKDVFGLNVMCWHRDLKSIPYCIPDELFIEVRENKKYVISPLIPGDANDYLFIAGEEDKYYEMYRKSMFAITMKKGGWDCLRHYEILASGCIPLFEDLEHCPIDSLVSFPKEILREAYKILIPWKNTEEQRKSYLEYSSRLFSYSLKHCSVSANASRFLSDMSHIGCCPKNILLLVGHPHVNYTRELNWIGIKRWASSVGSNAVEYPALEFLYDDFPQSRLGELYGNGFTYSRRISSSMRVVLSEKEIEESIREKKWDMIIYGKVGPDELSVGSIPNLPFWQHVFKRYSRDEIVFWYGGDGMQDMTYPNKYSEHLVMHCQYARCFVREFIRWNNL
jgi:hypothetical protein